MSSPKTVTDYIAAFPKETRNKLRDMRTAIRSAAPGAQEGLKWRMPAFSCNRILVTFAGLWRS